MAAGRTHHRPFKSTTPTKYKGVKYGSKAEAKRAFELDLLLRAGRIAWWLRQTAVDIGETGVDLPYRVDFLVGLWTPDGRDAIQVCAEDVKGVDTPSFRRHVKQWRKRGPFPLHVIRGKKVEVIPKGVDYGQEEDGDDGDGDQVESGDETAGGRGEEGDVEGDDGGRHAIAVGRPDTADHGAGVGRTRRKHSQTAGDDRGGSVSQVKKPRRHGPKVDGQDGQ